MKLEVGQAVVRKHGVGADGQRGHVCVMEDGNLGVKLDRTAESLIFPLNDVWVPDTRSRLQPMQLARVAYGADRELRIARGEYGAKDWMSMAERDRIGWMQLGPPKEDGDRRALYEAVMKAMGGV